MTSKTDSNKFKQASSKDFKIRPNRFNIDISKGIIDNQKEIKTDRLMNQVKIKLPTINQKKILEKVKNAKEEKNLSNNFIDDYQKNKNSNPIINYCRAKTKAKTLNRLPIAYYNYNNGNIKNNKVNSYKNYEKINNQEIKNTQNIFFAKDDNLMRKTKKFNTDGYVFCEKKITKLLKEKSSYRTNVINNYHENNRNFSNKNDNISNTSVIFDNDRLKGSKYYQKIKEMEKEVLNGFKNKASNIRQISVNFLLNDENENINDSFDIKKRIIKSYKQSKKNQDNERKIKEQKIIDSKKRKIFTTDNDNKKTNFNKFYKYNKTKKSIKHLKMILESFDNNLYKNIDIFAKNLDLEFKNFTGSIYIPFNEAVKIQNK